MARLGQFLEWLTPTTLVVETYDSHFQLKETRELEVELPIWGGFFAGEDYNFVVFGQENPSESDSAEVVRVVKYSKSWERLDQASLRGANTTIPFDAGGFTCAEDGRPAVHPHQPRDVHQLRRSEPPGQPDPSQSAMRT